jgi:hypothetical protein
VHIYKRAVVIKCGAPESQRYPKLSAAFAQPSTRRGTHTSAAAWADDAPPARQ